MATTKKSTSRKNSSGGKKGRVGPNIPSAGLSIRGSRYCGGGKKKACGGKKH